MLSVADYQDLINKLEPVLYEVGLLLVRRWDERCSNPGLNINHKPDATPVIDADMQANNILISGLNNIWPGCPIISEELPVQEYALRRKWDYCWLIDPLDGTQGFIRGSRQFSVNVSLIHKHKCILGLLYNPCQQIMYYAAAGMGAYKKSHITKHCYATSDPVKINSKSFNFDKITMVVGEGVFKLGSSLVRHAKRQSWHVIGINSALKLSSMAEGNGDFYPRKGNIYEWDIAAGQCILEQAGGVVVDFNKNPLCYNAGDDLHLPPFVAISDAGAVDSIFNLLQGVYLDGE